ncbi:centrosomal protein of 95 kDa-like isoform X1 [Lytechinus variegatus]|uniref:centrosomal protein of 95 kDa-like isoform X1 n=1 Tax=Lytechinus variegatus TaxID=7654 RepID=UPI001BB1DC1A|nr:centrosomal protein of 95 kDa-like isoform X1 [Lytechinus variegatus]
MPRSRNGSSESGSHKDGFVALANELFQKFHIAPVRSLSECEPSSFVTLYEGILGDRLKDIIQSPVTREDEIHNVQCVIDSLSRDVLHCDLSHITGQAIVDCDIVSIQYLLEILEGLVDYVMEQIGSETSSEIDDFQPLQEVSCHSEKERSSRRQTRDRSIIKTRSLESISLPSSISPRPDVEELSEGSNSTAELIRLGEESASYRSKHTAVKHDKSRDLNSTYQKSGLSEMFSSYGISEGRLSELTDTTLKDTTMSAQDPMSGSFSTITWPKAPSTASSPSPASKPAASTIRSRPAHTKAFMAEKMSPYNSLLGSLGDEFSGLERSRGYQTGKPATTTVHTESSTTKGYIPETAIDQPRRSLRLTPQATATSAPLHSGSRHRTPQQENKLESALGRDKSGSSSKDQKPSQRRSPRFTSSEGHGPRVPLMSAGQPLTPHGKEARYPAKLPQPDSKTRVRHAHSPPVRGSPAKSVRTRYPVELRRKHDGANVDQGSTASRRHSGAAIAESYPAKLPLDKASPGARRYMDAPTGQEVASSAEMERYPTRLPHHHFSSATGRYSDSPPRQEVSSTTEQDRYPAMLPPYSRTTIPSMTSDVSSIRQSPGVASRLRRSARRSLDQEKRERGREDSSLGADEEDSYDRSFMRRKVARRRRVAFEDEERQSFPAEGSDEERPSQRFRFSRESDDEENDMTGPSYSHLTGYTRPEREDQSRTDSEEEEKEEEAHSYDLRTRKKTGAVKKMKEHGDKSHRQRSVLLPKSLPQRREPLRVQFEDAMNRDAKGLLGKVRRQLADEASHQAKMKDVLRYTYEDNLREVKRGVKQQVTRRKRVTKQLDEDYKALHGKPKTTQYRPAKKYTAPVPSTEGSRRPSRSTKPTPASKRKRAASSSPTSSQLGLERPLRIGDDDLLPTLMHEFPFLHLSPHTAQRMWAQQMKHMEHLTKAAISQKYKKPKTQSKIEEAERKQEILVNIMKKELAHNQRLRDIKERRNQERALQAKAKEQRQVNARARRYYDEYRVRAKSRALKRRTKEEQIFKHLFEEGMAIQKMRIRELREYAKEKRENTTKQQQDEVESLENYYRDQFNLLAETIAKERHDVNVRDRAQANAMKRLKSDMRRKMEKEIREYQEQLYRDEDAEYFRQLEADRMKHELQMAKYKAQL